MDTLDQDDSLFNQDTIICIASALKSGHLYNQDISLIRTPFQVPSTLFWRSHCVLVSTHATVIRVTFNLIVVIINCCYHIELISLLAEEAWRLVQLSYKLFQVLSIRQDLL